MSEQFGVSGNGTFELGDVLPALSWGAASDPGPVRGHNEDFAGAFLPPADATDSRPPFFVVADGLGGHAAGEVASRTAVDAALVAWRDGSGAATSSVRSALRMANGAVIDAALDPGRHGMGSTATALCLTGTEAVAGQVGDSRAYRIRGDVCEQLTTDQSRVAEMVRMRMLTPEQAAHHPARSQLTNSLGGDPFVQVDVSRHDIRRHDVFVLCSDGLWDVVGSADLAEVAQALVGGDIDGPQAAARRFVEMAIDRETADNVTAVVVHVTSDQPISPVITRRSLLRRKRP
jgi:PPM family protein phosphatase